MQKPLFSILITTKNRIEELQFTLQKINNLLKREDVECIVFDDGSTDKTSEFVLKNYPKVELYRNEKSKGLIFCRNKMLGITQAKFAISLDDDAHFVSENPLEEIEKAFTTNPNCGVLAFRIFWSKQPPLATHTNQQQKRVQGFVGCGHAWRLESWKKTPNYPEWFVFYGEEEFAAYELFKKDIEIQYAPQILIQHRVEVATRKHQPDYTTRLRRSLRAGWFLYFMFFPWQSIPKKILYSMYMQIKIKVVKGDYKAALALGLAIFDVFIYFPKLMRNSNRFSSVEMNKFLSLPETPIYWKPQNE